MRHDIPNIGTMSEAYPHLIFHNFKSKLGARVSVIHDFVLQQNSSDGFASNAHIYFLLTARNLVYVTLNKTLKELAQMRNSLSTGQRCSKVFVSCAQR